MKIVHLGGIFFVHCGTPCNTFSAARKLDGGPPLLRSEQAPMGLARLSPENEALVLLGITCSCCGQLRSALLFSGWVVISRSRTL